VAIDPLKLTADLVEPETLKWARIHGILMSAAFGLLMPLAILSAKHKWLFNSDGKGDSSSWFCAHVTLQILALGLLAGGEPPTPPPPGAANQWHTWLTAPCTLTGGTVSRGSSHATQRRGTAQPAARSTRHAARGTQHVAPGGPLPAAAS
jgi:hypothetical protein